MDTSIPESAGDGSDRVIGSGDSLILSDMLGAGREATRSMLEVRSLRDCFDGPGDCGTVARSIARPAPPRSPH